VLPFCWENIPKERNLRFRSTVPSPSQSNATRSMCSRPQRSNLRQHGATKTNPRTVPRACSRIDTTRSIKLPWLIGREIVEALRSGEDRAEYRQGLLNDLSEQLGKRYGQGFSVTNLRHFRLFYQAFSDREPTIHHSASDELATLAEDAVMVDMKTALETTDKSRRWERRSKRSQQVGVSQISASRSAAYSLAPIPD
jgi:hypothetical protein